MSGTVSFKLEDVTSLKTTSSKWQRLIKSQIIVSRNLSPVQFSTVDARNPAPVDIENIPCFTGFHIYIIYI